MRSGGPGDESRRDPRAIKADVAQAEDFLFHLHRGSEMLLKNRVLEAKEELERALQHQPQDAKSQDLLAGVYFRLGVYPRAIEIWSSLVAAYPSDATLRVNLALAYIKTGQTDDALEHINGALRIQPDHERAWGYLGLINWRRGHIAEARDAFLRAGQASMARRMDELLAESTSDPALETARHRDAADDAVRAIADAPETRPSTQLSRPSRLPPPAAVPIETPHTTVPATIEELVAEQRPASHDGASAEVDEKGRLVIHSRMGFCIRADLAQAIVASAPGLPVHRKVEGVEMTAVLGGQRPIHHFAGHVDALALPPPSQRLHVLRVDEGPFFVVESRIAAFSSSLDIDWYEVPLQNEDISLVRFTGRGEIVLVAEGGLRAVSIERDRDARINPAWLVGFSGAVLASAATGVSSLALVLRGEGAALLA